MSNRCRACLKPLIDFEEFYCDAECKRIAFEDYLHTQKVFAKDKAFCYVCGTCKTKGCEHFTNGVENG